MSELQPASISGITMAHAASENCEKAMSFIHALDARMRQLPDSDQDLLDTFWERLWAFAQLHYATAGCGLIILTLRSAEPRMIYAPLARCAVEDYPILLQIQQYRPPTECMVMLLGGDCRIDRRLYRLRRMVRAA